MFLFIKTCSLKTVNLLLPSPYLINEIALLISGIIEIYK